MAEKTQETSLSDDAFSSVAQRIGLSVSSSDKKQVAAFLVSNFILTGSKNVIVEGLDAFQIQSLIDICSSVLR